ncbi:hypothetical protein [Muricoccus radiodurans]|uniref:hypothetical protein n=1 Tax=Muricoccus radiodurans TaxID=2231721 RepID=UPI003CECBACB
MTLSHTQSLLLSRASQNPMGLAKAPDHLPAAARNAVVRSLLKTGLLEEITAPAEHRALAWRQEEDETAVALRITAAGLRAIGVGPERGEATHAGQEGAGQPDTGAPATAVQEPPQTAAARLSLRDAASSVLVAWDAGPGRPDLPAALEALRAALASRTTPCRRRDDTPQNCRLKIPQLV